MEIILEKKPKNPIIIDGFPGLGLVGTIATEFLIEHLQAKEIGRIKGNELPPLVAVHDKKIVRSIGFFYAEKQNLLILHVISGAVGMEWQLADLLIDQANELKAKEIISLESVGVPAGEEAEKTRAFYYTNKKTSEKKLADSGAEPLTEGIIMGVTGALMQRVGKDIPFSAIFAETHTGLPDSKAAAKLIEVLDKYVGLDVDPKPLMQSAEKFEQKLKMLLEKSKSASTEQEKKKLSYVG
ncbi:PAC2 family protein [Candidatus Woesearchaeota archaeon]|nr:PAC2 family protein [Candidatus Woesearchaeota archaeon]